MNKPRNYTAVAMQKRYGSTTRMMKSRNEPRGGQRNNMRDWLSDWEEEQDQKQERMAELAQDTDI